MTHKSRLLYLKQYLEEYSDELHPLTLAEITAHLNGAGFSCGWRTVKNNIGQLRESDVDVIDIKGRELKYFVGDRHFELPELKLLVDAVQASRFISVKKSKRLLKKLTAFASRHQADELNRTVYTDKQIKSDNEKIYITIDTIHAAVNTGRQIRFKYYDYDQNKKKIYKHNRKTYAFSPYAMLWNGDHYYVVGHSESHGKIITLRVDRIAAPELTELPSVPKPKGFDAALYAQKVFQMYDGPMRDVTLRCENSMMKSVIDRFGTDFETILPDDDHFYAHVCVSASPTFYGWLFSFAGKIKITAPRDAVGEYISLARLALEND